MPYTETQGQCYSGGQLYTWNIFSFSGYYDPDGTDHGLGELVNVSTWNSNTIPCGSGAPYTYTKTLNDGSGYTLQFNASPAWWAVMPSGVTASNISAQYNSGFVTDANGNSVQTTVSGSTVTYTDTLGGTLTVSGSGTPSSPITYTYTGWSGQATVQVNYEQLTVQTNFACNGIQDYPATAGYLVSSISLPDSTSYQFHYETLFNGNVTGRLSEVDLPTDFGTLNWPSSAV